MEAMKFHPFYFVKDAARYIVENQATGEEQTMNDVICFGCGVYAYRREAAKAGLCAATGSAFYHLRNMSELYKLLQWLMLEDGYLLAQ